MAAIIGHSLAGICVKCFSIFIRWYWFL